MRKSLIVTLMVFVVAALPWAATAQDCQYHNAKIDFSTGANFESEDYDFCFGGAKLVGTLNGTYGYCGNFDTFVSSDTIFGDGWEQILTSKYDTWVETNKGTLEMRDWSWYDGDFGVETGLVKVIAGTGAFEGAFGQLLWYPTWPNRGNFDNPLQGFICTPVPED